MLGINPQSLSFGDPVPRGWHFVMLAGKTPRGRLWSDGFPGLGVAMPQMDGPGRACRTTWRKLPKIWGRWWSIWPARRMSLVSLWPYASPRAFFIWTLRYSVARDTPR